MDESSTARHAPAAWIEAIEAGRADLAAGRVIDSGVVMAAFEREDEAELGAAKSARSKQRRRTAKA